MSTPCRRRHHTRPGTAGSRGTALAGAATPRLGDLVRVFDALTREDADDAPAWYNLGVARAWLGDNRGALEALNRYLDLEPDESRAAVAATLMEVMRGGEGMEDESDYHEYSFAFRLKDGPAVSKLLEDWRDAHRLVVPQQQQEGAFVSLVLEFSQTGLITAGSAPSDVARLAGYFAAVGQLIRVWGSDKEAIGRLREEIRGRLNLGIGEAEVRTSPAGFQDVVADALIFPSQAGEEGSRRVLEHVENYYEGAWTQKPRRALSGNTPADAVKFPGLRKKLRGVIQFIQDCAAVGVLAGYDFDRLRRKLGLVEGAAAPARPASELGALGEVGLADLNAETLTDEQLEQAFQAAQRLDNGRLAKHFAKTLSGRPPNAEKPDRYYLFAYLTQRAIREGDLDAALDCVNEGESQDCTHNEGRRRNDYELRRGQVHARRGEADKAEDVFRRLIERTPAEMKFRTSAVEAMISLKQGANALRFAEEGLAEARKRNDRDSEGHLQELVAAAKRMG